jgi:FemAB-related protein (PEP-CTERM system-associated)
MIVRVDLNSGTTEAKLWDQYVVDHPHGTGYHLLAWGGIIEKVFGHQTLYLMALDQNCQVRGVLPLVLLSSWLFGRFMVSLPYVNYGGVLTEDVNTTNALLREATSQAAVLGADHLELRHCRSYDLDWPRKDHKVSMRLDLPPTYDILLKSFTPKLRSQIRRGEKEGMTAHVGGGELLDEFYAVFSLNMRDLGTPVYAKQFFAEILNAFQRDAKLIVVRLAGNPVAAGFVYGFRQMLEVPWAASDKRSARFAPNMFLYGAILKYACEQGYRTFDFGRSSKDSGTYRFKEQWGAKPVQLNWYYWTREGDSLPQLNPQNPKYQLAIRLWQQLPVSVTTILGPKIVKYLP